MSSTTESLNHQNLPKIPFYQVVDGFRIPGAFLADAYRTAIAYKPRPDDLFIVTYPKCGSTWVQNIVIGIIREGKPVENALDFMSHTPFLEMVGVEAAHIMKRPGAIKVHLPFHLAPWSPDAKFIYVARNPKDCCVSFYHHTENMPIYQFEGGEFDNFFELFIEGKTDYGDYFDHLLSWYEHKDDSNVLFITYEQLKKNTEDIVLKIAEFMDPQYKEALLHNNEKMLKDVLHNSSLKVMKETFNKDFAEHFALPPVLENDPNLPPGLRKLCEVAKSMSDKPNNLNFVRKGIVGDWRNYFSPMQNARMEKKFRERTLGTDIPELWKEVM